MRSGIDCKGKEWEERELSSRMVDLRGQKFGMLTPLFPITKTNKNSEAFWLCLCDCSNLIIRSKHSLMNGTSESCGCLTGKHRSEANNQRRNDLIGKKFNKLTIVDVAEIRTMKDGSKRTYYKCLCDCGNPNPVIIRGTDIVIGKTTSCGCAKSEAEARKREDLTGKRFGKLTVTEFSHIENQTSYWNCMCDCGTPVIEPISMLNSGHVLSCGCLNSAGELNITQILNAINIEYLHNKGYFKDLVNDKGNVLRYDFILFNSNHIPFRLIEFDGPQHDKPSTLFGQEEFERLQTADTIKNQYALSHNIPLVRIPYSKRDSMTLDDLFGDKYLYKGEI